jgi:tetratricopeptide (TPR) repeat protein
VGRRAYNPMRPVRVPLAFCLAAAVVLSARARFAASAPLAPAQGQGAATDPAALLAKAVSLHQSGDIEGAVTLYEQVLRLGGGSPGVRSNLGAAYAHLGRYDDAIEQYRKALEADSANLAIRRNLALALYKAGRLTEAAEEASRVVAAEPANENATLLLADCYLRLGQHDKVVELLQPVAGRFSEDRAPSYLLGMALLAQGRKAEAMTAIDRVLRDNSPEAHVFLAMTYVRDRDCGSALPEIQLALQGNPKLPLVHYLQGQCLMDDKVNDWEGAAQAFRRELEIDPNHFEANLLLGSLLREGGKPDEALTYLARAARFRSDDVAVKFSLGACYVSLGRTEEALPLLEAVAAAVPGHLQTHMQLAVVYHRLGRIEDVARERATVRKLQSEAETSFFQGVSQAVRELLGRSAPSEPAAAPGK